MEIDAGTMRMLALIEQERQVEDGEVGGWAGPLAGDDAEGADPSAGLALP